MGVIIISCYLTNNKIKNPKTLYSEIQDDWDDGAKTMFNMSSEYDNSNLQLKILAKF